MTQFSGICIGGPKDGERMIYEEPFRDLIVYDPPKGFNPFGGDTSKYNKKVRYNWFEVYRSEIGEVFIGLWLPEGTTLDEALHKVFAEYEGKSS